LGNKEWFNLYAEYKYTEKEKYDLLVMAGKQALAEIINQLFPDEQ
jgi:transcriptional accessory protein Tex/SPT6